MIALKRLGVVFFTVGSAVTMAANAAPAKHNAAHSKAQVKQASAASKSPSIPCESNSWLVGASALYLRPSFGGNGLGYSSFSNYGTDFFNNKIEVNGAPNYMSNVKPKNSWGFQLEAGYAFGAGNDINLNWYHLQNSTNGQLPQGTLFAGSASALYAGQLNLSPKWDAINIEFGQQIAFTTLQLLRIHAGVEFARVKNTFTNFPRLRPADGPLFITSDEISYNGFGPRFGAEYSYGICNTGLSLYAKGATSLLVGKAKQTVSGYYDLTGFNLYSTGNYTQSNSSVVIPEMEGKLGITFDYKMAQGSLGLDLGFMWVTYLNALVSQVGSGVVSSSISNSSAANFDLNGLYFGFTWNC